MERDIFEPEHDAFRDLVRTFLTREVLPFHDQWETDGQVDRAVWKAAGAAGLLGTDVPEEFGGGGVDDFRYNAIVTEDSRVQSIYGGTNEIMKEIIGRALVG